MTQPTASLQRLGQGFYWQDLAVGQKFQTFRRTITETDLVNFISCTGMLEAIFIEEGYEGSYSTLCRYVKNKSLTAPNPINEVWNDAYALIT